MFDENTMELLISSFPKILEFGLKVTLPLATLAFVLSTVLAVFVKVSFLQNWFGISVLPFLGFVVLAWYVWVNARCAKKFW